jgi:putative ABC transport system substrate-binding protein
MPVIGFLDTSTPAQIAGFLVAFRHGLLEEGFVEEKNVKIEYRWGENQNERFARAGCRVGRTSSGGRKRVKILHELIPATRSIAFLANPTNRRNTEDETREAQRAGRVLGLDSASEIETAFDTVIHLRAGALIVSPDPFFIVQRHQLISLSARHAIPASYARREFALDGGLMSYGASLPFVYRVVGSYSGKK